MKIRHGAHQERLAPPPASAPCPMGLTEEKRWSQVFLRLAISLMLYAGTTVGAQELRVTEVLVNTQGRFTVSYPSDANAYYVLYAGDRVTEITRVAALTLGANGEGQLVDPLSIGGNAQAFYRLRQVPRSASLDLDVDGLPDVFELLRPSFLDALNPSDAALDYDGDGKSNLSEFLAGSDLAELPVDPVETASSMNVGGMTSTAEATQFLYTGANPIQTGVAAGTIDAQRVCVLRGKVTERSGAILPGVTITVLDHPEFGQTRTRADGMFDLAVNGGGKLIVKYERPGYCPVQRSIVAPWSDYSWLPDVAMIPMDPVVNPITVGVNAPGQVARGSVQTDANGSRRATLILPPGICANIIVNGVPQSCMALNVRATEFTVGARGPASMPGDLPPNSAYTYCVELSADEADAMGASSVEFNQPICFYLENFLNFPVGQTVPMGHYDRQKGKWTSSPNGRVIKVLAVNNGVADVDVTGAGTSATPAQLAALGFTDDELRRLATLYAAGQTLWRACITHFSPWDCNWPGGPPPGAAPPPGPGSSPNPDNSCTASGSIIELERQSLGEFVNIVGTPYQLHYRSHRARGYLPAYSMRIVVSEGTLHPDLKRIDLEIEVAGRMFKEQFSPAPNQTYNFVWDGLDAYGRFLPGTQPIRVRIGNVFKAFYYQPGEFNEAFANFSGTPITGNSAREEITLWNEWKGTIGNLLSAGVGLGGWTLDVHHAYDSRARTLHYGDGRRRSASALESTVINTIAGGGFLSPRNADGGPATVAALGHPAGLTFGPDGSLYIVESNGQRVRKVTPNGIITTIAGSLGGFACNPSTNVCGDGGLATEALLGNPQGIALAPDGTLYISERTHRIRKVDTNGIISTIAGTGVSGYNGDEMPAAQARLSDPYGVAVGPDGTLYIADTGNHRIRRITADGIIHTVVGTGADGFNGDGRPALQTQLRQPWKIVFGPDDDLYMVDRVLRRIRKVGLDGIVSTVAGNGDPLGQFSDGGEATSATLALPEDMAFGPDGTFCIADVRNFRVRAVGPEGIITTIAGNGSSRYTGDGGPATQAGVSEPVGLAVGPDGSVFMSDWFNGRVRKISSALPGFSTSDFVIPSENGTQLYVFDNSGRHLRTIDAFTKTLRHLFAYDTRGQLSSITDSDNNVTAIERDTNGAPTAIISPYGQRTVLTTDANGYLASIANPANDTFRFTNSVHGLMLSLANPRTNSWTFTYDTTGRLIHDLDPANGFKALARSEGPNQFSVQSVTALQRTNRYEVIKLPNGDQKRVRAFPTGLQTESWEGRAGTLTNRFPDGAVTTTVLGPDPRWGMLASLEQSTTIQYPGGPTYTNGVQRTVVLANNTDPLSLTRWSETNRINGRAYATIFIATNRTMTNITPAGRRVITTFDSVMRPLREEMVGLAPIQYTYDSRGRLEATVQGVGAAARTNLFFYDSSGFLTNIVDSLGRSATFRYDLAGRVTTNTSPGGRVTYNDYDANGNLTGKTPPGRLRHSFAYSPVDLVSEYSPPTVIAGQNPTYFRSNFDRELDLITRPDGLQTTFDRITAGCSCDRLNYIVHPRGTNTYSYDAATGNLTLITTPDSGLAFAYAGSLLTNTTWTGPISGGVAYSLDNDLFTASRQINARAVITYQYDTDKLLTQAGNLSITRDSQNGLIRSALLGSLTNHWSYNEFGEPTNQIAAFGATPLYSVQYTRDALGRISSKTETIEGVTSEYVYVYDLAGSLATVIFNGQTNATYNYDSNDNRLNVTTGAQSSAAATDAQDRLLTHGNATYTYNISGELETKTVGSQTTQYDYDVFGNLIQVLLPNGANVEYLIDGQNHRIGKKINGALTQGFLYDVQDRIIAELDGSGNVVSEFVYATLDHAPDYLIKNGVTYRIIADHLGSPRLIIDATTGQIAQRIDYDAFGQVLADTSPGFQPFGFAGGFYDRDTSLVRFGARDYDPETGRWTAKDPILFEAGEPNLYAYVGNDPVNFTDPTGLDEISPGPTPQLKEVRQVLKLIDDVKKQMDKLPFKPGGLPDPCGTFNDKQADDKGMDRPTGPGGLKFGLSATFSF